MRRTSLCPPWLVIACLACLLVGAAPIRAAESGNARAAAKAEVQKAQLHYKLGRFEEALGAYSHAYELFPAPALLFNIGQCHKNLKNYERAIFFFEGYLREETSPNARTRTLAQELVAESRAELERQRAAEAELKKATSPAPAAPSSSVAAMFGAPGPPATAPVLVDASPAATSTGPLLRRWWFWTALGVGTAAVVTGVALYASSGHTTTVLPSGTIGTLDGRASQ